MQRMSPNESVFACGVNIPFYKDPTLEDPNTAQNKAEKNEIHAKNLMKLMLYYQPFDFHQWLTVFVFNDFPHIFHNLFNKQKELLSDIMKAVFRHEDPDLLAAIRKQWKYCLKTSLATSSKNPLFSINSQKKNQFTLIMLNFLNAYTFFITNKSFVPLKKAPMIKKNSDGTHGPWERIKLKRFDVIKPNHGKYYNALPDTQKRDKDFPNFYGLVPNSTDHVPILIAMGTNIPTGQGAKAQYIINTMPNEIAVGYFIYLLAKEPLEQWLKGVYETHGKVMLTGVSLGASLVIMLAMAFPKYISVVYAINPACWKELPTAEHPEFGPWFQSDPTDKPQVYILKQKNDKVSDGTYFLVDENVHLLNVRLTQKKDGREVPLLEENPFLSHFNFQATRPDAYIHKVIDVAAENARFKRKAFTYWAENHLRLFLSNIAWDNEPELSKAIYQEKVNWNQNQSSPRPEDLLLSSITDTGSDSVSVNESDSASTKHPLLTTTNTLSPKRKKIKTPNHFDQLVTIYLNGIRIINHLQTYTDAYTSQPTSSSHNDNGKEAAQEITGQWIINVVKRLDELFAFYWKQPDINKEFASKAAPCLEDCIIHLFKQQKTSGDKQHSFNRFMLDHREMALELMGKNGENLDKPLNMPTLDDITTTIEKSHKNIQQEVTHLKKQEIQGKWRSFLRENPHQEEPLRLVANPAHQPSTLLLLSSSESTGSPQPTPQAAALKKHGAFSTSYDESSEGVEDRNSAEAVSLPHQASILSTL